MQDSLPRNEIADNPVVDASLRQNLRTINEFIAECEARLKQNPRDQLTREYLNMAYQQKAELLNAMMDTGRSEH
jgi:DNA-directed RNA polymerase specialized sigma subunit